MVYGDTAAAFDEGGNTSTGYMDVAPQSAFDVARDSDGEDVWAGFPSRGTQHSSFSRGTTGLGVQQVPARRSVI